MQLPGRDVTVGILVSLLQPLIFPQLTAFGLFPVGRSPRPVRNKVCVSTSIPKSIGSRRLDNGNSISVWFMADRPSSVSIFAEMIRPFPALDTPFCV